MLKDYPYHLKVMKARWLQKSQFPISLMNWENIGSMHSSRPTVKIQNFEYMGKLGKFMANLRFTVENKMRNSQEKGWSHFKLNINDWDFHFLKRQEFINDFRKTFSNGKNGMNSIGILPISQNFWPTCPEDIYFYSLCI